MNVVDHLAACAGEWRGSSRLQDPHANLAEDSPSTATVTPVLDRRFVRFDYTWGYQGRLQSGCILFGGDPKGIANTAHWIDTWHMGHGVLACEGPGLDSEHLSVRGSYAVPPDADWNWRIDLDLSNARTIKLVMYNISPDGKEDVAVEASYSQP